MKREFDLIVNLKDKTTGKDAFAKTYRIAMWDEFVKNGNPKEHSFANHTHGFVTELKFHTLPLSKPPLKKWEIYVVNYGWNVGSEIIGLRPSIVYKNVDEVYGEDVIVIPLTSMVAEKMVDKNDVRIQKDASNKLYQDSYARLRQIRATSVKRLGKQLGIITDEAIKQKINEAMKNMLATDN